MLYKYENTDNGRWFYIDVEPDLLNPFAFTVRHGGTRYQRSVTVRRYGFACQQDMQKALVKLMRKREKRGYHLK